MKLLSIFILSSSSGKLPLIHEFCIYIEFASYGLIKQWLLLELDIKPFSFLLESFTIEKTYFINYNLQTNKQTKTNETFYHPLYPSLWLRKTIFFSLIPRLNPTPTPNGSKAESNQVKCQKVLAFKTFLICCHFLLYIV